ncbi:transglycosylase domain-containing protein [Salipaludibacillus sp. HK11]|uniref:transglycosylase domain-containing protein n=1 Tax=Salipaludibacillus sp. HK11 TaxID=3394320 RepID=UPI0039FD9E22
MKTIIGNLFILIFISVFSFLFMETTREFSAAQSLHEVLDKSIELEEIILSNNSVVLDKDNNLISDIYSNENRIELPFDEIPSIVIDAFIAAEDQSFYEHPGFDMTGIARAFFVNLNSQQVEQGGSTVTQQLVRNLYLSHSQTYERKLTELLYSYHLERKLSKDKILELYINSVYFANGVYGIEAASLYYFSESIEDLTLAQVAFLCAIPNNPSHYNPIDNSEQTHERKNWILSKMLEENFIDEEEFDEAKSEEITLRPLEKQDHYPDYVDYVFHELKELISINEGYSQRLRAATSADERSAIQENLQIRVDELLASGITIETSLDPEVQAHAVNTINNQLGQSDIQGATSIIDHDQAEIVAITGGVAYNKADFHHGFRAYRQPGSAIKPLLVFAPLLEETNMNKESIIDAGPIKRGEYEPNNFGNAIYGKVSLEEAFNNSYNTAAVRILDMVSIDTAFSYFNKFDFLRISTDDYRLPSALGGLRHGVNVNELTQAYSTFATRGVYRSPKAIRSVTDGNGNVLYESKNESIEVWSESTTDEMRNLLSTAVSDGTGRAAQFSGSNYIGGKTGTTNNFHDLWFVGSSDRYTAGVWLGKDEPSSIYEQSQRNLHTQLWRDIMMGINQ